MRTGKLADEITTSSYVSLHRFKIIALIDSPYYRIFTAGLIVVVAVNVNMDLVGN